MAMVGTVCVLCLEQLLAYIAQRLASPPASRSPPALKGVMLVTPVLRSPAAKGSKTVTPTLRRPSLDVLHDPPMCCDEETGLRPSPAMADAALSALDLDHGDGDDHAHCRGDDGGSGHSHDHGHGHSHGTAEVFGVVPSESDAAHTRHVHKPAFSFVRAVVMDFSIAVHSVIIGLALGVNTNLTEIRVLIVALAFHQFFEGVGLGVVIAVARIVTWQKAVLVAVFCSTTALGVAIGIGVEKSYAEGSSDHMYARGILNSFATGNLIYVALVEMVAEDMNTVAVQSSWRLKIGMVVSLCIGAAALAVLAIWA